jgi:hypothetical protein
MKEEMSLLAIASSRFGNFCALLLSVLLGAQTASAQSGTITGPITISPVSIQAYNSSNQLITNQSLTVDSTLNYSWPVITGPAPAMLNPLSLNNGAPIVQGVPDVTPCAALPPGAPQNAIVQDCIGASGNFEFNMVQSWLAGHNMPASDQSLIYQYGRRDLRNQLRGFMLSYIDGVISNSGSTDATTYQWMQALIYPKELNEYDTAVKQYNGFDANKCVYQLNPQTASALSITWSGIDYCYPISISNLLNPPQPPPAAYFTEYGREQAYDNLITPFTDDPTYLSQVETQAGNYTNYLIGAAAGAPVAGTTGALAWQYWKTLAPYSERPNLLGVSTNSGATGSQAAGDGAANTVAEATGEAAEGAAEDALSLADVLSTADFASGVGVILLAVQIAVTEGLQLQAENQNLDSIAAFLSHDQDLHQNKPFDLTSFFANDSTAGNKIAESFLATTLPEHASTQPLPAPDPNARFYVTYYPSGISDDARRVNAGLKTSVINPQQSGQPVSAVQTNFNYLSTNAVNPAVFYATAAPFSAIPGLAQLEALTLPTVANVRSYDDHWFLQQGMDTLTEWVCVLAPAQTSTQAPNNICPASTEISQFTPQLAYFDFNTAIRYTADRLDNGRFLVAKDPAYIQSTDSPCSPSSSGLTQQPYTNCSSYITNVLYLPYTPDDLSVVPPGSYSTEQMTVQIPSPPQLVGPDTWIFPVGTLTYLPLNVDGQSSGLPCTVSVGASLLPLGVSLINSSFTGTAIGPDGEYDVTATAACAGVSSQHTYKLMVRTPATSAAPAQSSLSRTNKLAASASTTPQYQATFMWPTSSTTVNITKYKETEFEILTGGPVTNFIVGQNALPCGLSLSDVGSGGATSPQAYVSGWPTSSAPCTAGSDNQITAVGPNGNDSITLNVNMTDPVLPNLPSATALTWFQGRQNLYYIDGSVSDVTLRYNFSNLPSWVIVKDTGTNITELIGTPPISTSNESFQAQYQVAINAGTAGNFPQGSPHTLDVTVLPVSAYLQETSPLLFQTGVEGSGSIGAVTPASQPALPGNFNVTNSALPNGLSASAINADSISISGIPGPQSGGIYHVPVQFTDANNQITSLSVPLMVTQPADLSQLPKLAIAWVGLPFNYTIMPDAGFPTAKTLSPGGGLPDSPGTLLSFGNAGTAATLAANGLTVTNDPGLIAIGGTPTTAGESYNLGVTAQTYINTATPQRVGPAATGPFTLYVTIAGDVNLDGVVNCADVSFIEQYYGTVIGTPGYNVQADVNRDGVVNIKDLAFVESHLPPGTHCQ